MVDNLNPEETVSISGTVQKITYKNEANGYTVAEVKADKESITVVGLLPFLSEGDLAEFFGKFTVHPTYGKYPRMRRRF